MTNPLLTTPWGASVLNPTRDRELERFARRRLGIVPELVRYLAPRRWVSHALISWSYENGLLTELDFHLADLAALVVSREGSCRYCYAVTRGLMRLRGLSEERVHAVEQRLQSTDLDPRTAAAMNFARSLARGAPLPDVNARQALYSAGFSECEVRELAFVVAAIVYANRLATMVAVPPGAMEIWPDRWLARLATPLLRPWLQRKRPSGSGSSGVLEDRPFANVLTAFADTPIATVVGSCLADMHASEVLLPRSKALMFAVVAHALDCDVSATAALTMMQATDPNMDREALARILAHLSSPELDAMERRLAAFARETIWYTPVRIQERARALRADLTDVQFVEVIGVASLANAMCRLAAAVVDSQ